MNKDDYFDLISDCITCENFNIEDVKDNNCLICIHYNSRVMLQQLYEMQEQNYY